MSELRLEAPSLPRVDSYRALVEEFRAQGEALVPFVLEFPSDDGAALVRRLDECARGVGLPAGFVPHSTYWMVRGESEVVGVSNLRHSLTDKLRREGGHIGYGVRPSARRMGVATELLRQTLGRARAAGLAEVLLTCAKGNEGSMRAIRANGGEFVSEEFIESRGEVVQRYRIALPALPA